MFLTCEFIYLPLLFLTELLFCNYYHDQNTDVDKVKLQNSFVLVMTSHVALHRSPLSFYQQPLGPQKLLIYSLLLTFCHTENIL